MSGASGMRGRARRATRRACVISGSVACTPVLVPALFGLFPYGSDLTRVTLGLVCALQQGAASGSLLLSPLLENGGPLLARPDAGLLYPPRWLALVLPADLAVAIEVALHLGVAGAVVCWLTRTFGVRPGTAALSGIAWAFSGTVLDLVLHSHYLVAAAWLPLVWAGSRRWLRRPEGRGPLVAVIVGLLGCLLGAEPQAFAIGLGLVGVEGAAALVRKRGAASRACVRLAGACFASLLLGWMQWGLVYGELALTRRAATLSRDEALSMSYSPPLWLGTVLPGVPSEAVQPVTSLWAVWNGSLDAVTPWNRSPYLGLLLVACALVGALARRASTARLVSAIGLVFALGEHTPVLPLLMKFVPLLALFRYPSKYLVVAFLGLAMLAAVGADLVASNARWRRRFLVVATVLAIALLSSLALTNIFGDLIDARALQLREGSPRPDLPTLVQSLTRASLHAMAVLAGGILVVGLVPRLRRYLMGLVVLDLFAAVPMSLLLGPGLGNTHSPVMKMANHAPGPRPVVCASPGLARRMFASPSGRIEWLQTLYARMHLLSETQACDGLASAMPYSPIMSSAVRLLTRGVEEGWVPPARALGCTHLIRDEVAQGESPASAAEFNYDLEALPELAEQKEGVVVQELKEPVPEAFVARSPVLYRKEDDAVRAIANSQGLEPLLRIVDDPLGRWGEGPLPVGSLVEGVRAEWRGPGQARVLATGSGGAVVGIRTAFLAGWRAEQCGRPLPVVRAMGAQVAAVVQDVACGPMAFEYSPAGARGSVMGGVLGLLLGLIVVVWPGKIAWQWRPPGPHQ